MLKASDIKNLEEVAEQSVRGVSLYYNIANSSVSTKQRYEYSDWYVTEFLRKNTEEEIVDAVNRMLSM